MGRRGICSMLRQVPEAGAIVACRETDEAFGLIQSERFDVLMAWASAGLEKLAAIARENDVRVIVLLHSPDEDASAALAELAVDGFLLEEEITEDSLRAALDSLARGAMAMPGRLARNLLGQLRVLRRRAEAGPPVPLTPRERETLVLLAQGMSNRQIARTLGISEHGAKRHVANVLSKLDCPNRTLAVATALNSGLIPAELRFPRPRPRPRPGPLQRVNCAVEPTRACLSVAPGSWEAEFRDGQLLIRRGVNPAGVLCRQRLRAVVAPWHDRIRVSCRPACSFAFLDRVQQGLRHCAPLLVCAAQRPHGDRHR